MISDNLNSLQSKKIELQVKLNELLHSKSKDEDKINELKSDILYLDKQIEKIVGKNEIRRRDELKRKKQGVDEINKNNYYNFKNRYKKIRPMTVATNRIIATIDRINNIQYEEDRVRVKIL